MKIDKLLEKNGKYKIYLDNGEVITTYDQVIIDNKLLYAKEIDDVVYEKVLKDTYNYGMYDKCIKLINKKMRTKKEIESYLYKQNIDKYMINNIITRLINNGLLNDDMYIKAYINDKLNFTMDGPYKIRNYLVENELDMDIIDRELSKIDMSIFEDKLIKYITKKALSNKTSIYQFRIKMLNDLISKGYDKETILRYLDNVKVASNIKADYEKIYTKLSKKYDGDILMRNVKNKLYQKGYNTEEINEIIK